MEGDIGGAIANPMGSDGTQRIGRCPSARATARKGLIPSAKTRRERSYIANVIDQTRPTQRKSGWHAQDIAIERLQGPPHMRTKDSTKKERGMEWVSDSDRASTGTEEQKRDRCLTPEGEETNERG